MYSRRLHGLEMVFFQQFIYIEVYASTSCDVTGDIQCACAPDVAPPLQNVSGVRCVLCREEILIFHVAESRIDATVGF